MVASPSATFRSLKVRSGWPLRTAQAVSYADTCWAKLGQAYARSPRYRDAPGSHAHISVHDAMGMQVGQSASSAQADVQQASLPGQGCWARQQGIQRTPARQCRSVPAHGMTQHEAGKQCPFTKQREGRQRLVAPFTIVLSSQQKERNSCLLIGCIRDLPYDTQHGLLRAGALRCLFKWSPPLLQPLFGMEGS